MSVYPKRIISGSPTPQNPFTCSQFPLSAYAIINGIYQPFPYFPSEVAGADYQTAILTKNFGAGSGIMASFCNNEFDFNTDPNILKCFQLSFVFPYDDSGILDFTAIRTSDLNIKGFGLNYNFSLNTGNLYCVDVTKPFSGAVPTDVIVGFNTNYLFVILDNTTYAVKNNSDTGKHIFAIGKTEEGAPVRPDAYTRVISAANLFTVSKPDLSAYGIDKFTDMCGNIY